MKMLSGISIATASVVFAAAAYAQGNAVKPQQTVQLKPGSYGCLSKEKLDAVSVHERAGEQQKMQEYFTGYQCLSTPADQPFRVVQVIGHDVEFVNAANTDQQGLWTTDRSIRQ